MKTIKATANQRKRTFTIRTFINGKILTKYRTISMSKDEFEECEHNTERDWADYLRDEESMIINWYHLVSPRENQKPQNKTIESNELCTIQIVVVRLIKNYKNMWNNNKKPNFSAIQKDIDDNFLDLTSSVKDVYEFISEISEKYCKPVDPKWGNRVEEDPYTDLLFAMLEVNGIELY